jgi:hypothetical protein
MDARERENGMAIFANVPDSVKAPHIFCELLERCRRWPAPFAGTVAQNVINDGGDVGEAHSVRVERATRQNADRREADPTSGRVSCLRN